MLGADAGGTNEALNTVNLVITGAVSIILAWLTVQRGRDKKQADQRHADAVVERQAIVDKADEVVRSVQPTNGYDTLGEALEGLEKRVNEMGERLARGDARFDNMEGNEQRIAEQLAVVAQAVERVLEKLTEVGASVEQHHHVWDDPDAQGGPSLLEWAEQARLREAQAKRRKRGGK